MLGLSGLKRSEDHRVAAYGADEIVFERLVCARTTPSP